MSRSNTAITALCRHFRPVLLSSVALACIGGAFVVKTAYGRVVEEVVVRGAQFIPEADVRETCGAQAGIEYLDLELRAIEDCLMSTGVFETVALSRDEETLYIDVQELNTRPGRIDATLAYASQDGIIGSLSFERYNLFKQTYGAINLEYGADIERYGVNLYRTEVFDSPLDLGVELFGGRSDYDDRSFTEETLRGEAYLAWAPTENFRLEGGIGYRDHALTDLDSTASPLLVKERTGGISAPYVRLSLKHKNAALHSGDQDEWRQFGYSIGLDHYFWNIGTSDAVNDTRLEAHLQFPIAERLRLLVGVETGTIRGTQGNATRAIDRYYPGADTFRGFSPRGIGPRDGGDFLGGNHFARASIELQRDFGEVMRTPLRVGLFLDSGASWGLDDTLGGTIDDGFHRRSSVGLSLTFDVGKTPVSLYLAEPIEYEPGDRKQVFGMSVQTRF